MDGVAFDLPHLERLLVHVGQDAARRFAVEADARDDPVPAALLPGPAGRLVLDIAVPLGRRGVAAELSHRNLVTSPFSHLGSCGACHESGTLCPASTQMYSQVAPPARANSAARLVRAVPADVPTVASS